MIVGTATSQQSLDSVDSYPKRLFTPVQINDEHTVNMKIDTVTDTCLLTVDDLQALNLSLDIQPCSAVLKGYGGQQINSLGTTTLKVAHKDKSISTRFTIIDVLGQPSMIGCQQAQELGLITANIQEITRSLGPPTKLHEAAQEGHLLKESVLEEHRDCFDKLRKFPGTKYHITLNKNATPYVQYPCISSHYTNRNWRKCLLMISLRKSLNRLTGLTQ